MAPAVADCNFSFSSVDLDDRVVILQNESSVAIQRRRRRVRRRWEWHQLKNSAASANRVPVYRQRSRHHCIGRTISSEITLLDAELQLLQVPSAVAGLRIAWCGRCRIASTSEFLHKTRRRRGFIVEINLRWNGNTAPGGGRCARWRVDHVGRVSGHYLDERRLKSHSPPRNPQAWCTRLRLKRLKHN